MSWRTVLSLLLAIGTCLVSSLVVLVIVIISVGISASPLSLSCLTGGRWICWLADWVHLHISERSSGWRSRRGSSIAILPPAALDRPTMNHLTLQLHDRQSSVLVSVELDESETTIGLHTNFGEIADGLEERNKIRLGTIGNEIANVDSRVVRSSLGDDRLVGQRCTLEVTGSGSRTRRWSTADGGSTLGLLIGPVDTDSARSKPFTVHCGDSLLCIGLVSESEEAVTARLARVHIPHDSSIRESAESTEGFTKNLIIDLGAEIADEDMVVVGSVFLVLRTLIRPVNTNLGVEDLAAVEGLKSSLCGAHIHIFDETVVKATVLIIAIGDDFDMLNWSSHREDFREHILSNSRTQVANIKVSPPGGLSRHRTHRIHADEKITKSLGNKKADSEKAEISQI